MEDVNFRYFLSLDNATSIRFCQVFFLAWKAHDTLEEIFSQVPNQIIQSSLL